MRSAAHNGALNNSTKPTAMNVCFIGSTSPTTRLRCAIVLFERRAGGGNHQHVFLRDQKLSGRRRPSFHGLGRFGAQPLAIGERRRERGRLDNLFFLGNDKLLGLWRPLAGLARLGPDTLALLKTLV